MASLGDLIIKLGVNSKEFDKGLGNSMRKLNQFGKSTKKLGKQLSTSLTLPLAGVGAVSFKLAADFEASMAKVKAVSGATASEFQALEKNALDLGSSTKFTASEVSSLQLEFSKLGFSADEITKVTESTLALAQATGSDLAVSAEVAGATLRGFGLDASETQRVTDVMAASFSSTALDMGSFKDSMKFVAPVAKAAGLSIEETTAMLGALANNGIKGSQAGTALRRIISDLGSTGGNVAEAIKGLAAQGLNLADAKDEVGRSSQSALLILAENTGVTDELTASLGDATGTASEMAGIMDSTAEGSLAKMRSALEGAAIVIGKSLAPLVVKLAAFISDVATKFSNLSEGTQGTIIKIGALVAGIGPLLMIIPTLVSAIGTIRLALSAMMGPMGLVVAGITALAMAFIDFGDDVDDANSSLENIQKTAGASVSVEGLGVEALSTQFKGLVSNLDDVADSYKKITDVKVFKSLSNDQEGFEKAVNLGSARVEELDKKLEELKTRYDEGALTLKMYNAAVEDTVTDQAIYENIVKTSTAALAKFKEEQVVVTEVVKDTSEALVDAGEKLQEAAALEKISTPANKLKNELVSTESVFGSLGESTNSFFAELQMGFEDMVMGTENLKSIGNNIGATFSESFREVVQGTKDAKSAMGDFVRAAIDASLAASTGLIIEAAISSGKHLGPGALIAIPALITAGIGLVRSMFQDISVPAMAEGGIVSGNTLVQVGEYAGASTNPEVIAPLDKLKSMIGGAGGSVKVQGVIRGRDIFLTNERAGREINNLRGAF